MDKMNRRGFGTAVLATAAGTLPAVAFTGDIDEPLNDVCAQTIASVDKARKKEELLRQFSSDSRLEAAKAQIPLSIALNGTIEAMSSNDERQAQKAFLYLLGCFPFSFQWGPFNRNENRIQATVDRVPGLNQDEREALAKQLRQKITSTMRSSACIFAIPTALVSSLLGNLLNSKNEPKPPCL